MNCDIFIRSYWKDLEWLEFCLASVDKYCRGFRSSLVVLPRSSWPWLRRSGLQGKARFETCPDYRDDYLGQQATKLLADTFTDAEYICHVDSDCVFSRRTRPEDLIPDGRPNVYMRSVEALGRRNPWRGPTEKFLRRSVGYDFMQRPPFTFPRRIYQLAREHTLAAHNTDIETYVLAQPPRGFSEYNALGALAWERHRESFIWIDIDASAPVEPHCRWYWSWGGIDADIRAEIRAILDEPNQ
ncbi:MAG TPA: DUF6492 family protein [Blastocatellia bacterium]|nr:DUF6492 family protein [Blastocatellia bacterium]